METAPEVFLWKEWSVLTSGLRSEKHWRQLSVPGAGLALSCRKVPLTSFLSFLWRTSGQLDPISCSICGTINVMATDQDAPLSITIEQALKQQCADGTFIVDDRGNYGHWIKLKPERERILMTGNVFPFQWWFASAWGAAGHWCVITNQLSTGSLHFLKNITLKAHSIRKKYF